MPADIYRRGKKFGTVFIFFHYFDGVRKAERIS